MKTNWTRVFWKALEMNYKNMPKHIGCPVLKVGGDLHVTFRSLQGQTNDIILCPPRNYTTFVWNIFSYLLDFTRYFDGKVKMEHPVYIKCPDNATHLSSFEISCIIIFNYAFIKLYQYWFSAVHIRACFVIYLFRYRSIYRATVCDQVLWKIE